MTRPSAEKPTVRLSYSTHRGREIIVSVHPTWLGFRLKRQKKVYQMDIQAAFERACLSEAEKERAERQAAKAHPRKKYLKRKR